MAHWHDMSHSHTMRCMGAVAVFCVAFTCCVLVLWMGDSTVITGTMLSVGNSHAQKAALRCQQLARKGRMPRIIHQSYKTRRLPDNFKLWQSSWQRLHPDWCYIFWTDVDNRHLVETYYPWFLRLYDSLPKPIMKADAARYLYMHQYGGLYVDLDIEAIRPFDKLFDDPKGNVMLAYMGFDYKYPHNIPNAFMASKPGHPIWMHCANEVYHRAMHNLDSGPEDLTGPVVLYHAVQTYIKEQGVQYANETDLNILEPGLVYAYDWHNSTQAVRTVCSGEADTFDTAKCKALFPDALAISYWSHSWETLGKPTWSSWR